MSWSFGFNILFCAIGLVGAYLDHGETWATFKNATHPDRRRKLAKLLVLWGMPLLSLIALPFTYIETVASNRTVGQTQRIAMAAAEKADALNPFKQHIASITASASFRTHVTDTNVWRELDGKPHIDSELVFFLHSENLQPQIVASLMAKSFMGGASAEA